MQKNLRKMLQKYPKGPKRSPKDTTRGRRERQGCHQGAKVTTNGAQREPKGRQRVTKMVPKLSKMHPAAVLEKIIKTNKFLTAKMLPEWSKHMLKFIKKNMRHRTSWNLKKHCISAVKTLKSRSRHRQKASKTAAKNQSKK